jgi:hypothetical protein
MRKNILFLLMIWIVVRSVGQDCTESTLKQKPGDWKESLEGSVSGVAAADLAREKNVVAALHAMIKSKYVPMGIRADFSGAFALPQPAMPVNGYHYRIIPLNYFCDGNSLKTAHETSTYFQISVNFFDSEIYEEAQGGRSMAEGFHVMPDMPIEEKGHFYFKEKDVSLGFGMSGKSRMWLITYPGKLPFSYVSKREFLEKRKSILASEMHTSASGFNEVLQRIDIEKKYKEAEFKNDPEKLKRYIAMDYQSIKDRYEKLLADNENKYKPALKKIDSQLVVSDIELREPAIVKLDPNDNLSYLFTDDEDASGKILIKPNPVYFDKKLPRSSPQFFTVQVSGNHKDPIALKVMTDLIKAVDFETLQSMLGK